MPKKDLPISTLRQLIAQKEDGTLVWKEAVKEVFPEDGKFSQTYLCKTWNKQNAGKPALTYADRYGYRMGMILKHRVKAHQVAWALHYGEWPSVAIDHVNGDTSDNRVENLRLSLNGENARNTRRRKDNSSGVTGVYPQPNGRFVAQITAHGKTRHIGSFDTLEAAASARRKEQEQLEFGPNHGKD
jgi:hypothetical protein